MTRHDWAIAALVVAALAFLIAAVMRWDVPAGGRRDAFLVAVGLALTAGALVLLNTT